MPGGIAYTTAATMPGTGPTEKIITKGIAYTRFGIVCNASKKGEINDSALGLRPSQMPKGIAISIAKITAMTVCVRVSTASGHLPVRPMKVMPTAVVSDIFQPATKYENALAAITIACHARVSLSHV